MTELFYTIFFLDILLMAVFSAIGYYARNKRSQDIYKGELTLEIRKSRELSNAWEREHPILSFFQEYYYDMVGLIKWKLDPAIYYRESKWFIQRGLKGYSQRDVWGLGFYLNNILIKGLKDLKTQVHGAPTGHLHSSTVDLDGESTETKEWKKIIDKMIWTFEAADKISERSWIPVWNESKRKECEDFVENLNKPEDDPLFPELPKTEYYLMTSEDMAKYHEGWQLFKEYYFDLCA